MASGIITNIKLDPFYQKFLKQHFECDELVFTFPKGHELQKRLNSILTKNPHPKTHPDYGKNNFRIELFYSSFKDIRQQNFISPLGCSIFAAKVKDFYNMIFHEFISERYRHFNHKEIVYLWIEKYNFGEEAYDRIERDSRRYRKKNYNQTYYQKQKLKNVNSSPVKS